MNTATLLSDHIRRHYGDHVTFAREIGALKKMVEMWLRNEWVVLNNRVYAPRRRLPAPPVGALGRTLNAVTLDDYIQRYYPTLVTFARAAAVPSSQVCYWKRNGWVVIGGRLYNPHRRVPVIEEVEV